MSLGAFERNPNLIAGLGCNPPEITWKELLAQEKEKPYFKKIISFLLEERARHKIIYPPQSDIFNAIKTTPFESVKVVILGQDPYHGPNQAHGLAFSVKPGVPFPPSLKNIFLELATDLNLPMPSNGYLTPWAEQGVFLLNTVLTVESGKPQSHAHIGWQYFTDHLIMSLNQHPKTIVFLLWGSHAQAKRSLITAPQHHILCAPHPSPLSAHRGFLGCRHFSKANELLRKAQREEINWQLSKFSGDHKIATL